MTVESIDPPAGNGFKNVVDTILAPKEAFDSLRVSPTWGAAFLTAIVLLIIGYFLQRAATVHASVVIVQHMLASSPQFSGLPDEKKQEMLANAHNPNVALGIVLLCVTALLFPLLNAVILLIGNAIARGTGTFKSLWCGSMNIVVPTVGIGAIVIGIITIALGPDHYDSTAKILGAAPNLGMLAPGLQGFAGAFLSTISIFVLWGLVLNVVMMRHLAQVRSAVAWIFPIIITLLMALASAGGTQAAHTFGM